MQTKYYRSIAGNYHRGRKLDLEVTITLAGRTLEIVFFQNVVRENPNGGEYDFSRRQKMPFLIRKQYELERRRIAGLMAGAGFPLLERCVELHGMQEIQSRRRDLADFQGQHFYAKPPEKYNSCTATNGVVRDADVVYFRGHHGRWSRGVAYHNINNMWWVLLPCGTVTNVANFHLHHRADVTDLRGRAIEPSRVHRKLSALRDKAVKAEAYERAAVLRDVIRDRFPQDERKAA